MKQAARDILSSPREIAGRAVPGIRFDGLITLFSLWMIGGAHLDAWAHHRYDVETFFSPWHAFLYSGFLALTGALVGILVYNLRKGRGLSQAVPRGYELSYLGAAVFMAGGLGDMLWHEVFGIEVGIEALLSPTHLVLALGAALIVTGPLRTAWLRSPARAVRLPALLPALVAAALLLSLFIYFTMFASPTGEVVAAQGSRPTSQVFLLQSLGVASILLQAAFMMGVLLFLLRRWQLPFGSVTLVLGLSTFLAVSVQEAYELLPFALIAGIGGDLLIRWLAPTPENPDRYRWFAFGLPVLYFCLYFATLALTGGVWWTVPMWAGSIVMAGLVGLLLSFAFIPPEP